MQSLSVNSNNLYKRPWHRLDVDTENCMNENFDRNIFLKKSAFSTAPLGIWYMEANDMLQVLNKQWLEYVADTIMPVGSFLMFYRKSNLYYPEAHIDLDYFTGEPHAYGMNFVFTHNDDSYMAWYDVQGKPAKFEVTPAGTKYCYWPMKEVEHNEIDRVTIGNQLTLVNVGLPHNVITKNQERWVVSLRFKKEPSITNWNSAVDYYYNHIQKD